jgi:D-alanyl-D-alanine carboxypeptidase
MKRLLLLAGLCTGLCQSSVQAQVNANYAARLQAVLDSTCARYHIKGASSAVYIPGSGIWTGVYGESEAGQPITSAMAFPLNSNTKTYVASIMLKLQEAGQIQLSDTIGKWIQNKPNVNGQITVRQLLNHTSGLYNYTSSVAFNDSVTADLNRIWQPAELLNFVGTPSFSPGAGWEYSNTNYLLAGMIMEQVTGMPVAQAFRSKLLTPQGLNSTWFFPQETPSAVIPHFWFKDGGGGVIDGQVFGYSPQGFYSTAQAAGALFSTAEDNVRFWQKLISGQIVNSASLTEWKQVRVLSSTNAYGLGVFRRKNFNGTTIYQHGGTGAGAINENLTDSATGVCITVLTNQDSASNSMLLNGVVAALHKVTQNPPAAPTAVGQVGEAISFAVFPNPAGAQVNISVSMTGISAASYSISDELGRVVRTGRLENNLTSLLVSDLQAGMYLVQVADGNRLSAVKRFAVIR